METRFEYQISPELAEKIAIEQFDPLFRLRWLKLGFLPFSMACLGGLLLPLMTDLVDPNHTFRIKFSGIEYTFTGSFIPLSIGIAFGFGVGFLIDYFIRSRIIVITQSAYRKMGPVRTVSWNSEGVLFGSAACETKIYWQMIDKMEARHLGIYGFFRQKVLFAIPKEAFPSITVMENLIQTWQNHTPQLSVTTLR